MSVDSETAENRVTTGDGSMGIDPPLFVSQQSGLAATDTKEVDIDPSYARKRMGVRILG